MKINIEIIKKAIIHDPIQIKNLNEKALVPKMMIRRRLSRNAKIVIYLADQCNFTCGNMIYGSAYGEVLDTITILDAIKNKESISPTSFQNSVYNTAASYHSIVHGNTSEILTLSCGNNTSYCVMQQAALSLHYEKEVFVCASEAMNFHSSSSLNICESELEYGLAFVVKRTHEPANIHIKNGTQKGVPLSLSWMKNLYDACGNNEKMVIEIEL
ncbi:beta-ketoacyl synthase chain length factor [Sulfurimonas sp. SAG-AH-194-I05]|nr:beta-ketoacyl synthase chain length factor [Sulfurimonas sp. SAG-AH-194-I05]MDF1874734.1 beta-ketoacyl synthase chain length factor [Sulfurimonas sp. SAG-AH-194-I05]